MNAASKETIEESYRRIAEALEIPNLDKPGCNVRYQVSHKLESVVEAKWLLIYDNLNDESVMGRNKGPDPYSDHLPSRSNGSVLITTQDRGVALTVTESIELITVGKMSDDHIQKMFIKNRVDADVHQIKKLSETLGGVPLAIQQAINYIMSERENGETYSVKNYLRDFHKKKDILSRNEGPGDSVAATLDLSYRSIRDKNPSAADLLLLMSCFERQGIPEEALSQPGNAYKNMGNDDFRSHIRMLIRYSFISVEENKSFIYDRFGEYKCYEMHSLVHQEAGVWRKSDSRSEIFVEQFITRIFAPISLLDWNCADIKTRRYALFPHRVVAYDLNNDLAENQFTLIYDEAYYAFIRNKPDQSIIYYEKVLLKFKIAKAKGLDLDAYSLAESFYIMGRIHQNVNRLKESEECLRQGIEESKLVGNRGKRCLICCKSRLAYVLKSKKEGAEAQRICKEMLKEYENSPEDYHGSEQTIIDVGRMYVLICEFKKAAKVFDELKAENTNDSYNMYDICIASTYDYAEDWNKAEILYKNLIAKSTDLLTEKHGATIAVTAMLVRVLSKLKKHEEARHWWNRLRSQRDSATSYNSSAYKYADEVCEEFLNELDENGRQENLLELRTQNYVKLKFWFGILIIICYFLFFHRFGIVRYPRLI